MKRREPRRRPQKRSKPKPRKPSPPVAKRTAAIAPATKRGTRAAGWTRTAIGLAKPRKPRKLSRRVVPKRKAAIAPATSAALASIMRDARGFRMYARFRDQHGGLVLVKQASPQNARDEHRADAARRVWIQLEQAHPGYPVSPLLDVAGCRALIRALEAHIAIAEAGAPLDHTLPIFDWEDASHRARTWAP